MSVGAERSAMAKASSQGHVWGLGLALLIAGATVPLGPHADAQLPLKFDAVVEPFDAPVKEASFRTFDGSGRPLAQTRWRIVKGTGNDRENYLASTGQGLLLDFGGEWLRFSDDEGKTWSSVLPTEDFSDYWSYEGSVATAPGGDVVAAGQDAVLDGVFRAMTFKYEAAPDKWFFSLAESSSPIMDRPAIGVVPGPLNVGGTMVPYISVLRGGVLLTKSYWSYSLDGLNYDLVNSRLLDSVTSRVNREPLQVDKWDELDWLQSHDLIGIAPLGRGQALAERPSIGAFDTESHAPRGIFDAATLRWRPHEFDVGGPPQTSVSNCVDGVAYPPCMASEGRTLADSRGNLHHISYGDDGVIGYWFSRDGGATWDKTTTPLLEGFSAPFNAELSKSFKVSGKHYTTALVVHAIDSEEPLVTQDLVYVFSFRNGLPRVRRIYALGNGDYSCFPGGTNARLVAEGACDFPSITFVRSGRIAASFTDSDHREPAIAIQLPRR